MHNIIIQNSMGTIHDISLINLSAGLAILIIPLAVFYFYKVRLIGDMFISAARMIVQLLLVAFYLEWIFELNSSLLNSAWVALMLIVGSLTSISRIGLNIRYFILPFSLASLTAILIIDSIFLGFIIKLDNVFDARYFIPISGMVLGNSINHNIVGLSTFFSELKEKADLFYFLQTNTGNQKISLRPFISNALKKGLNPLLANMSVIGLVTLPGMMTGQILGGSSPSIAIKYQMMVMLSIFVGCTVNLTISIFLSTKFIFDPYGRVKKDITGKKGLKKIKKKGMGKH